MSADTTPWQSLHSLLVSSAAGSLTITAGHLPTLFQACKTSGWVKATEESSSSFLLNFCRTLTEFPSPIYIPNPEEDIPLDVGPIRDYLSSLGGRGWQCGSWIFDAVVAHPYIGTLLVVVVAGLTGVRCFDVEHGGLSEVLRFSLGVVRGQRMNVTGAWNDGEEQSILPQVDDEVGRKEGENGKNDHDATLNPQTPRRNGVARRPVTRSETQTVRGVRWPSPGA